MNVKINYTQKGVTQYPMHSHKNYEVMLYTEGQGYMRSEIGDIPFEKGSIIIVAPNIKHGSISTNGFRNISIEGEFEGYFNFDGIKSFSDGEGEDATKLAQMIYANRYGKDYLSSLCTAYLCLLAQRIEEDSVISKSVRQIMFEISQKALDWQIDLTKILSKQDYAEDYIRACFKKIVGKTPHEFLTEIRMKHAIFLMEVYPQRSLTEIAEMSGYIDYVYFSKKFKAFMGVSPRQYRNK